MADGITIIQPVAATADELWRACATPEGLQGWQADSVEGAVRPGARLELAWPTLGARLVLRVVEVQAPRRLVLEAGSQRIVIEPEHHRIVLTHFGSASPDEAAGTTSGWRVSLATLAHCLERHPGSQRQVHWAVCVAATSSELAHAYFTDGAALSAWLTSHGEIGEKDSAVCLGLRWGTSLTGHVLAHTPGRDLAVSWQEEDDAVLAFRTLPLPGGSDRRLVALQWSTWGRSHGPGATACHLDSCVHRLSKLLGERGSA
ncbi:MAG: SRPBCC domain-containing protein [Polyangiaceae bacterium]|nr:SRPBCC domain-containing protein [Polyangiaceae bacterium]